MASGKSTPMMDQYLQVRAVNPDCLLFFRMGDFFELFFEDAHKASELLGITLTHRGKHLGEHIPMAGVPVHAVSDYIYRLTMAGYKVAICDQVEDAKEAKLRGSKSVVKRELTRIFTSGTITEESLLRQRVSNYLCSIHEFYDKESSKQKYYALAWVDLSTAKPRMITVKENELARELARIEPREIITTEEISVAGEFRQIISHLELGGDDKIMISERPASSFMVERASQMIQECYSVTTLQGLGEFSKDEIIAFGVLLDYIYMTQVGKIPFFAAPVKEGARDSLGIDAATRRNLELTRNYSGGDKHTLLSVIDVTNSNAGARLLRSWLASPSARLNEIKHRHETVKELFDHQHILQAVRSHLSGLPDVERAVSRLALKRGSPRDLVHIRTMMHVSLLVLKQLHLLAEQNNLPNILKSACKILENCPLEFFEILTKAIIENSQNATGVSGVIKSGFDQTLDDARKLRDENGNIIQDLEQKYKTITGIKNLKIRSNSVLGYFIEAPPVQARNLVENEIAEGVQFKTRQTLTTAVRLSTEELQEIASEIFNINETIYQRELMIFDELVDSAYQYFDWIRNSAEELARIDVLASFAYKATSDNYVCPVMTNKPLLDLQSSRHPVVEQAVSEIEINDFVPNNCNLKALDKNFSIPSMILLTGPNMAGKSTYLRQIALIVIMAQIGCWVPAAYAEIGVVDQVFSRVGASDDLARGRSTFMVEMVETAAIMNQATKQSLVIIDEIGRGTSTFDGLAIAWSCAEFLSKIIGCRTMFATHYHELTTLTSRIPNATNKHVSVEQHQGDIIFLYKVEDGFASKSWGVQVARLAGLPVAVTSRAKDLLSKLEYAAGGVRLAVEELPLFNVNVKSDGSALPLTSQLPAQADVINTSNDSEIEAAKQSDDIELISTIDSYFLDKDIEDISPRKAYEFLEELYELRKRNTSRK